MSQQEEESDQLPESQPGEAGADDAPGNARKEAKENPGGADSDGDEGEGQATGNPKNAG